MIKICLQSGHWSKAGSGAPNEQATNKRITDRLAQILRDRGFSVFQTDWYGYNDPVVTKTDYNLFLALHCDMDYPNDGGSGFADAPAEKYTDGTIQDYAHPESERICKIINDTYFPEVKINYVSHSNANTKYYYMWKYLTAKTPCVLLEMGQSIDPHDSILLGNTELIASGIGRAICKAFNVSYETIPPTVPNPPVVETPLQILQKQYDTFKLASEKAIIENGKALAAKDLECQEKLVAYKKDLIKFINL